MQLEELKYAIQDEKAAIDFAVKKGLLPERRTLCPICCSGNVGWYRRSNEGLKVPYSLRCSKKKCRKKWSVTKNTWFFGSRLSVQQNFLLIYHWIRDDSVSEAAEQLKLSKTTVTDYYQFCREVCYVIVSNWTKPIGGYNKYVSITDFYVHRGHHRRRIYFLRGEEIGTSNCFLLEIRRNDQQTLLSLLKTFIINGSKIITDNWDSHGRICSGDFKREFAHTGVEFIEPEDNNYPKRIKRCSKKIEINEPNEARNRDQMFQYLYFHPIENLSTGEKFDRFLEDVAKVYPGPFRDPLSAIEY